MAESAPTAIQHLQVGINQVRHREMAQPTLVADLVDHLVGTELAEKARWHFQGAPIGWNVSLVKANQGTAQRAHCGFPKHPTETVSARA